MMQKGLWLSSIGQHKGKTLNMGMSLTVSQFIFWLEHSCLWKDDFYEKQSKLVFLKDDFH